MIAQTPDPIAAARAAVEQLRPSDAAPGVGGLANALTFKDLRAK